MKIYMAQASFNTDVLSGLRHCVSRYAFKTREAAEHDAETRFRAACMDNNHPIYGAMLPDTLTIGVVEIELVDELTGN